LSGLVSYLSSARPDGPVNQALDGLNEDQCGLELVEIRLFLGDSPVFVTRLLLLEIGSSAVNADCFGMDYLLSTAEGSETLADDGSAMSCAYWNVVRSGAKIGYIPLQSDRDYAEQAEVASASGRIKFEFTGNLVYEQRAIRKKSKHIVHHLRRGGLRRAPIKPQSAIVPLYQIAMKGTVSLLQANA
jgi:hypothetical protein